MAYDPSTESWANADYLEQATAAGRLSKARAFVTELNNAITQRVNANGESIDPQPLVELRKGVIADIRGWLQAESDAEGGIGLPRAITTVTRDHHGY